MQATWREQSFLFVVSLHLSGLQSRRPQKSELCGGERLSRRAGQRVWLGEAVQRASVPCLPPELPAELPYRSLPQYIRAGGNLDWRQGEGAGGDLSKSGGIPERRNRDLGRWRADAHVPVHR